MKQRVIDLVALIIISSLVGCKNGSEHTTLFLNCTGNQFNILKLSKTHYTYKGKDIFSINYPYPFLHANFLYYNYLLVDGQMLSFINIDEHCASSYLNGNYKITEQPEPTKDFKECDISLFPFIDFSIKKGDTLTFYNKWIRLDDKFYDKTILDTLYKFRRYNGLAPLEQIQTIILASKNIGIVGAYDTSTVLKDTQIRTRPIGYTHKFNGIPFADVKVNKPAVKLETIKEFKMEN